MHSLSMLPTLIHSSMFIHIFFVSLFFVHLISAVNGSDDVKKLYQDLMEGYSKYLRPVKNIDTCTPVVVDAGIGAIIEVSEIQGSIKLLSWLPMIWTDEYLIWDPKNYNGLTKIQVNAVNLWIPDIVVFGATDLTTILPLEQTVASIEYDATVSLELSQVLTMNCFFDIVRFPFDTQNCTIIYSSWAYSENAMSVKPLRYSGRLDSLHAHPEWDLVSFNATYDVSIYDLDESNDSTLFPMVSYHLVIKRKPEWYIYNLVFPSFIVTALSFLGLFTPFNSTGEREEKVTLGLTSMLAMSVILNIISSSVPKSSQGLPLLGKFVLYILIEISIAIIVAVLIVTYHRMAISRCWSVPDRLLRALCLPAVEHQNETEQLQQEEKESNAVLQSQKEPSIDTESTKLLEVDQQNMKRILSDLHICQNSLLAINKRLSADELDKRTVELWNRVFDRIDFIALIFFSLLNILLTCLPLV